MKSAQIRNDRQKKIPATAPWGPFFLPKVWGRDFFLLMTTLPT
jgi:hypothetical protein